MGSCAPLSSAGLVQCPMVETAVLVRVQTEIQKHGDYSCDAVSLFCLMAERDVCSLSGCAGIK